MSLAEGLGFVRVDPVLDIAAHRWSLVLLVVAWALAAARGHRRLALAFGLAWAFAGPLFWALALGRPLGYGLDPHATRGTAELVVAAASGRAGEAAIAGEPVAISLAARLAVGGLGDAPLIALAALAPALVAPLLALAAFACGRGERAAALAILLLALATGDLDALRGTGLTSGVAYRPEAALVLPIALAAALLVARLARGGLVLAALVAAAALSVVLRGLGLPAPAAPPVVPIEELAWALTLDHGLLLALAALRLWQWRQGGDATAEDRAGAGFAAAGLALGLAGVVGLGPLAADPWPGHVGWRLGLLLLASGAALPLLHELVDLVAGLPRLRTLLDRPREDVAAVLLVLVVAPGSFLAWWAPHRLDPLVLESLEPLSPRTTEAAAWLAANTPADAVVLCSTNYLPEVLLAGRRRVLRAPALGQPEDGERRDRAERSALAGRENPTLYARYGLRYVFIGPGDFREHGIAWPYELDDRPGLILRHTAPGGFRVYELRGTGESREGG
ncbi:MAG: hypothetical protein NDJ94_11770 [Vicinamibacteria bacterium]|nr:hypothetical protein [Vicinamibacteria bacterium]